MAQSMQRQNTLRGRDEHLSAWIDVLGPLLDKMPRARWNNVRWQHIVRSPIDHSDYLLAASFGGKVFSTTSFRGPSRANHPGDLQHWTALGLLSSWALEVSRSCGMSRVDPRWIVFSTFPGSQDHLPPDWIEIAKDDPTISWYRWKCAAALVTHKRVRGMGSYRTKAGVPTGTSIRRALLQFPTFPKGELGRLATTLPESIKGYWGAQPLVIPDPKDVLAAFPEYALDGRPIETRLTPRAVGPSPETVPEAPRSEQPETGSSEAGSPGDDGPEDGSPEARSPEVDNLGAGSSSESDVRAQGRARGGRRSDITFPPKWAMAVEKFVVDIPKSAKTYRAILRRVVRLCGSFDPKVCQAYVDGPRGTSEMRSVWNRFATTLNTGESERAPTFLQAAARRADHIERARVERHIPQRIRRATEVTRPTASVSVVPEIPRPEPIRMTIPTVQPLVVVPQTPQAASPAPEVELDVMGRPMLLPADDAPTWATGSTNKYIRMLTQIPGAVREDYQSAPVPMDKASRAAEVARMAEESEARLRESDRAYREQMAREIEEAQAAAAARQRAKKKSGKPRFTDMSDAELSWADDEDE